MKSEKCPSPPFLFPKQFSAILRLARAAPAYQAAYAVKPFFSAFAFAKQLFQYVKIVLFGMPVVFV